MDVPEGYENFVEQALIRQFKLYGANPPDSKTLECLKKLALFLVTDQGRNATTPAAITAAHVIVPNYLNDDWVFHDLFIDAVNKCLAGEEATLVRICRRRRRSISVLRKAGRVRSCGVDALVLEASSLVTPM